MKLPNNNMLLPNASCYVVGDFWVGGEGDPILVIESLDGGRGGGGEGRGWGSSNQETHLALDGLYGDGACAPFGGPCEQNTNSSIIEANNLQMQQQKWTSCLEKQRSYNHKINHSP